MTRLALSCVGNLKGLLACGCNRGVQPILCDRGNPLPATLPTRAPSSTVLQILDVVDRHTHKIQCYGKGDKAVPVVST